MLIHLCSGSTPPSGTYSQNKKESLMAQKTVSVSIEELERLKENDRKLQKLIEHGVDNWSGYGEAMQELEDDLPF